MVQQCSEKTPESWMPSPMKIREAGDADIDATRCWPTSNLPLMFQGREFDAALPKHAAVPWHTTSHFFWSLPRNN